MSEVDALENPEAFSSDAPLLEAAGPPRSRREIAPAAVDLIVSAEVGGRALYERKLTAPIWPRGRSGVTIGIGYDIGTTNERSLRADWAGVHSDETLTRLARACGVTGPDAAKLIRSLADIRTSFDDAMQVFRTRSLPSYIGAVEAALPNTSLLGPECLGALTSLVYNRGGGFQAPGDRFREMRAIHDHMVDKAFALIPREFRAMERLWRGDPNSAGLITRREAEAALFEQGLADGGGAPEGVDATVESVEAESVFTSAFGWLRSIVEAPTRDQLMFRLSGAEGPAIEVDEHYVEIRVLSARIVNARRWTSVYHGAVHATVNLISEGEGAGRVERQAVLTPDQFRNLDPRGQGKVVQIDRAVLGPTPFRGDLRLSLALFSVKSSDLAAPYLTLLGKLSQNSALGFLAAAQPFVEPLREASQVLFGATDSASLECGVVRGFDKLTADTWVCIGATQEEIPDRSGFRLEPDSYRLLDNQGHAVEDFPYLVFRIMRSERRDDWTDLPNLKGAWDTLSRALASGDANAARAAALSFRRACFAGGDLLPKDAARLAAKAEAKVAQALGAGGAESVSAPGFALGSLRSLDPVDEDATPNVGDDAAAEERSGLESVEGAFATWRVAASLEALRTQVNAAAPHRSKASDGAIGDAAHASRGSDHNPWVRDNGVGVVTARDFTHDPAGGCDAGALARSLIASRDPRLKYVIWNRQIASATLQPWTWRPYDGANPHNHHCHISVSAEKALYDDVHAWKIEVR